MIFKTNLKIFAVLVMSLQIDFAIAQEAQSPPISEFPSGEELEKPKSKNSYYSLELPIGSVSLCEEKESIGFNWVDGSWVRQTFRTERFVIKKVEHRFSTIEDASLCQMLTSTKTDFFSRDFAVLNRCYQISEVGQENTNLVQCAEQYRDAKLHSISCNNHQFKFVPDGLYVRRSSPVAMDLQLNPENGYKDSLALSHGGCAKM